MASFKGILGQIWNFEKSQISQGKIGEIKDFQLWPKIPLKLAIFPLWKNYQI